MQVQAEEEIVQGLVNQLSGETQGQKENERRIRIMTAHPKLEERPTVNGEKDHHGKREIDSVAGGFLNEALKLVAIAATRKSGRSGSQHESVFLGKTEA